jgi:hypothetical protein
MKTGWFVRKCRKVLDSVWNAEYLKLGHVNRWKCRDDAWNQIHPSIGLMAMVQMMEERYKSAEQKVLNSNQDRFRQAINQSRERVDLQRSLPGIIVSELHSSLSPHAEKFVRAPGPDKEFDILIKLRDIDFDVIYDMAVVRDEHQKDVMISKEDYDFMDRVRQSLGAPRSQTLGRAFGF